MVSVEPCPVQRSGPRVVVLGGGFGGLLRREGALRARPCA
jgi:hypothetical protein